MGQGRERLLKFLQQHPFCCFCGGSTFATTRDHVPSRGMFAGRIWPEGYEFPACYDCNHGTQRDDAIVAVCSRIHSGNRDQTPQEKEEWRKQLRAFNERHPGEPKKMLLTA